MRRASCSSRCSSSGRSPLPRPDPHFIAITLFRKADYAKAGLVVMPNVTGELAARHTIVRWIFACVAASLLVVPLGIAHRGYLVAATVLGAVFFSLGCYG